MADKGCVIAVHRDRGVIQRRQQIFLDVADIGGAVSYTHLDVYKRQRYLVLDICDRVDRLVDS